MISVHSFTICTQNMSWKSAAKTNQKTHRERHQPESRKHLGILEKKKDYKLRAKHYNETRDSIKFFKKVALNKNQNEFFHHMINSKIKDGVHKEKPKPDDDLTEDQLKLMRLQDSRYINMKHQIEARKVGRLQSNLHMIDSANEIKNSHTFFVDDKEELKSFNLCEKLGTHKSLLDRKTNRIRLEDLPKLQLDKLDSDVIRQMNKEKSKAYRELERRIERERDLAIVKEKLEHRLVKKQPTYTEDDWGEEEQTVTKKEKVVFKRKK